jgi:GAF domain-containing protein
MATGVASGLRDDVLAQARALAGAEPREQRRILDRIAERLAADIGDVCCIALLRDGRLDPVALGHRDRAARRLLTELVRLPLGLSAVPAATIVMVTQKPIRAQDAPMPLMLSIFPRLSAYVRRYPIQSMLSLPLRGEPEAVGAMGFVRHEPGRPYTDEDEAFLLECANSIADGLSSRTLG